METIYNDLDPYCSDFGRLYGNKKRNSDVILLVSVLGSAFPAGSMSHRDES